MLGIDQKITKSKKTLQKDYKEINKHTHIHLQTSNEYLFLNN